MTDKQTMPADGGGHQKGAPDGVSGAPTDGEAHGRTAGGESGGGGYANPHSGKEPTSDRFMGHGGQTGEAGGSAADAASGGGETPAPADAAGAGRGSRTATAGARRFDVVEDDGTAAAETGGKVATDAPYEQEQKNPGSG